MTQIDEFVLAVEEIMELAHSSSAFWSEALGPRAESYPHLISLRQAKESVANQAFAEFY